MGKGAGWIVLFLVAGVVFLAATGRLVPVIQAARGQLK
jgi:hypothetical protein